MSTSTEAQVPESDHCNAVLANNSSNDKAQDQDGLQRVCYVGNITLAETTRPKSDEIYTSALHPVNCGSMVVAATSGIGSELTFWKRQYADDNNNIWKLLPKHIVVRPRGQVDPHFQISVGDLVMNSPHANNAEEGNSTHVHATEEVARTTASSSGVGSSTDVPSSKVPSQAGNAGTKTFGGERKVKCSKGPRLYCGSDDEEDDTDSNCALSDLPSEYESDSESGAFTPSGGESDVEESFSSSPALAT
ncbi:hypothetical protein I302_103491 [Kwoniella bestiolae CBS 10118]|uniref:Uncharacterized protein n=1 Tax=Kwoniella bestiolae CBS 10118 TaxID=1296100 RepID=A0A1B9G8M6_9TREE|nr:hypothetical protein I302_02192 [Kwoniella bestiolae CBS 10118]OCF27351.1 hypothetical protein I302_02192 [Kwoniella bestiolae CBS 10118]